MEDLPEFQWKAKTSKREAILASAYEIFYEKGFYQAKIEEIAQRAGVGKGTVYLYFSSKEHLLREMLKEVVNYYLSALRQRMGADASPRERLHALFRTHAAIMRRHQKVKLLIHRDFDFVDEGLKQWLFEQRNGFIEDLQALVEEGIRAGQFRPVDARLAALMLEALFSALVFEEKTMTKQRMQRFLDILERGILAQPTAEPAAVQQQPDKE